MARFLALMFSRLATTASAGSSLRKVFQVSTAAADSSLADALAGGNSSGRIAELEDALRPTYNTLPKSPHGLVGFQATRYALHRLLLQRHGWYVKGLEPSDSKQPPYLEGEWVPSYLQGILSQRLGSRGIDLHELAALAVAMEDLIHKEAADRVEAAMKLHNVSADALVDAGQAKSIFTAYLMTYLGAKFGNSTPDSLHDDMLRFADRSSEWDTAHGWVLDIFDKHPVVKAGEGIGKGTLESMADDVAERFGAFNDGECKELKGALLRLEGSTPGRVPLTDFYARGLVSHWAFRERASYLRRLGALDASPGQPRVIIPNYVYSRPQCLEASSLYAICCRNECEDLMQSLELSIASGEAEPRRVAELAAALPSASVPAPRNLSAALQGRLREIADGHGGRVRLHGRLFAQWMHHAYPRECPFPHEAGTTNPQTPDEWMSETGEELELPEEERRRLADEATDTVGLPHESADLPWSDVEEYVVHQASRDGGAAGLSPHRLLALGGGGAGRGSLHRLFALGTGIALLWYRLRPAAVLQKLLPH